MKKLIILCLLVIVFCCSCGAPSGQAASVSTNDIEMTGTDSNLQSETEASQQSAANVSEASSATASDALASVASVQISQSAGKTNAVANTNSKEQTSVSLKTSPASAEVGSKTQEPYSQKTADTILTVTGNGIARDYYFSLADLQSCGNSVSADYFSRGKDPQEQTNHFTGIRVDALLGTVVPLTDGAKKVTFTATDGYAVSYSISALRKNYIDETDLTKSLSMILAWEQDDQTLELPRLVMGQIIAGDYNRTNWVRDVVSIEVKAG